MSGYKYSYLAFGAGVQSTALLMLVKNEPQLLLNAVGHLPEKAYFADTGAEPPEVYLLIEKIKSVIGSPIPIEILGDASLLNDELTASNKTSIPYFVKNADNTVGMLRRKCTQDYKIRPIIRAARRDSQTKSKRLKPKSIAAWIGISIDEAHRMKDARDNGFENIYPLVEMGWDRTKCFEYLKSLGLTVAKSGCFFCPFRKDWEGLKRDDPATFDLAVDFDRRIRTIPKGMIRGEIYLHKKCLPLDELINLQGHLWNGFGKDFEEECDGYCGV